MNLSSGARPVPHRDGMILVRDQRDLRHLRENARHLADDAGFVDDRRAGLHAVATALVDIELLGERVATRIQHLDRGRRAGIARLELEESLEALVLGPEQREVLHGRGLGDQVLLEARVVVGERTLRPEVIGDVREGGAGQLERPLHRIKRDGDRLSHALEVAVARVREQQCDRQQAEEREPREGTRTPMKERRGIDGDVMHGRSVTPLKRAVPGTQRQGRRALGAERLVPDCSRVPIEAHRAKFMRLT